MLNNFILRGNICYSKSAQHLDIIEQGYLICEAGVSRGVFKELPEKYKGLEIRDFKNNIIIPGLVDLHVHAPQFSFRSLGMDMELLEWLETNAFPEEAKFKNTSYAEEAYGLFVDDLVKGATTRASIFATIHPEATQVLAKQLEKAGIKSYVGKLNMDRNSPEILCEDSAMRSAADTRFWLEETLAAGYEHVKPILTPRFTPSCSDELMDYLSELQREYHVPLQSHLSENYSEIEWVRQLCPESKCYGDTYDRFGLFGSQEPVIMAHCVHSSEYETALMKERGVMIAHCPNSNTNVMSGIAPVRFYMDAGLSVGLGSDVAGGFTTSIFRAMSDTIRMSKMRWRLVDDSLKPLTIEEAFYLATRGGGAFFGKVGSFEEGYEFDAVVLDDDNIASTLKPCIKQRLERLIYLADDRNVRHKYAGGVQVL